jgi:hypothetical protein
VATVMLGVPASVAEPYNRAGWAQIGLLNMNISG